MDQNYLLDNMMVRRGKMRGGQVLMLVKTLKSRCKEVMGVIVTDMVSMVV